MPRVNVNGADLWVEDTGGGGEPVLFAHGLLWSTWLFHPQLAALRAERRCVAFDFRGQGRSAVTPSGYDMDTLAEDAAALIERLGLAPVHFVGLSMGGFVGLRLAARRPGLIRSLALLETAADAEVRANVPRYRLLSLVARVAGWRPVVGPVMKILFGRTFLRDPARAALRDEARRRLTANDLRGELRALDGVITRRAVEDELPRIVAPALVLSGDEDVAVAPARSRALAERLRDARFVTVPRAGHSATLEEPAAVTAALRAFWASLSPVARPAPAGAGTAHPPRFT